RETSAPLVSSVFPSLPPPPPSSTLFPYTTLFRSPRGDLRRALRRCARRGRSGTDRARARRKRGTPPRRASARESRPVPPMARSRSEEHTSELQSPYDLVCRLLLEKKNETTHQHTP